MTRLPESIDDDSIEHKARNESRKQVARLVGLLAIAGLVTAFVVQNLQDVSVHFWITNSKQPLIYVVVGCILIGGLAGYIAGLRRGKLNATKRRWWKRDSELAKPK